MWAIVVLWLGFVSLVLSIYLNLSCSTAFRKDIASIMAIESCVLQQDRMKALLREMSRWNLVVIGTAFLAVIFLFVGFLAKFGG